MNNQYVLLTAAKNEEQYIGEAIESILRQTVLPAQWIIVDDGSTDNTAQVVSSYAAKYPFIKLHSVTSSTQRNFGSKVKVINFAYPLLRHLQAEFVGIQDADIAPQQNDFYQSIMAKFTENPKLGISGGYIYEKTSGIWQPRKSNSPDSVAGGIQLFRRECYEQIDGYKPLTYGGEDWLAQLEAKMADWEVYSCPEYPIYHYRVTSSAEGRIRGLFKIGMMDASIGSHPFFELLKCARRLSEKPVVVGGVVRACGFLWWKLTKRNFLLPSEVVKFLRQEQLNKIVLWSKGLVRYE